MLSAPSRFYAGTLTGTNFSSGVTFISTQEEIVLQSIDAVHDMGIRTTRTVQMREPQVWKVLLFCHLDIHLRQPQL